MAQGTTNRAADASPHKGQRARHSSSVALTRGNPASRTEEVRSRAGVATSVLGPAGVELPIAGGATRGHNIAQVTALGRGDYTGEICDVSARFAREEAA